MPGPGGRGRSARAAARLGRATRPLEAAIDEAIARKPKGHDFIIDRRHSRPAVRAAHERDRRLSAATDIVEPQPSAGAATIAFVASDAPQAQAALAEARRALWQRAARAGRRHRARWAATASCSRRLHRYPRARRADLRHASRQRRLPDEQLFARRRCRSASRAPSRSRIHPLAMTRHRPRRRSEHRALAINEVSLLRQSRQAAKLRIIVDEIVRLDELMADGVLVATPGRQHRLQSLGARADRAARRRRPGADADQRVPAAALARRAAAARRAGAVRAFSRCDKRPVSAAADYHRGARRGLGRRCARARDIELTLLFDPEHNLEERVLKEQFLS